MCGRATLSSPSEDIAEIFDATPIEIGPPRFNIAPSQPIVAVRSSSINEDAPIHDQREPTAGRELTMMRWGLIPWWAKPDEAKKIASRCIQARAETAPRAPAFRDAFRRHRCLVVVDGFFEWKTLPDGRRIPHHVVRSDRAPFAIASVWDRWQPANKGEAETSTERVESCAVLTTRAGGIVRDSQLHDRMPLVLPANDWTTWLEGSPEDAMRIIESSKDKSILDERVRDLLVIPVSTWVNDVKHDDPRCIERTEIPEAPAPIEMKKAIDRQMGFSFLTAEEAPATKKRASKR